MVVLSVAILNKKGKVLLARQYVPMVRLRIEGLLAAFPKLVSSEDTAMGKQHTFIETDEVRYIYQPMDTLYLLLITNMQSNIIEDLNTLRVIAKLVPEYCHGHDEEAVTKHAFDLVFATDEVITPMGYREQVTFKQIQSFMEMDSAEEKLTQIIEDSKVHNQQEYMKKRAQEFDKARMKERGNSQKNFPGADYLSSLGGTFGIGNRSGKQGGDTPGTIITHGFGSDSVSANAMNDRHGEKENESEEDHGVDKGKKGGSNSSSSGSSSSSSNKKGQQRTKGWALTSKSKKSDALFTEAMKADEQTVSADMLEIVDRTRAAVDQGEDSRALAPIELTVTESLNVELDRDHTLTKFEVKGNFEVVVNNPDCAKCVIHTGVDPNAKLSLGRVKWNLHPRMDEANWKQGILSLKDADKSFRIGRACKTSILRWRLTSTKEEAIPIRIEFWPETELNKIRVNATYTVEREEVQLKNVIISFPTPTKTQPEVEQCDGTFTFDARASELRWIIGDVATDAKGSFEYRLENCELESLWPVTAHFDIDPMYSGMNVSKVTLQGNENTEFQFDVKSFCHAETYRLGEAS